MKLILMTGLALAAAACAEADAQQGDGPLMPHEPARTLSVVGIGEAAGRPDMAIMSFGVVSPGKTAGAATSANAERMTAVLDALRGLGIEARDMQTANFSLNPVYARDDQGRYDRERIAEYEVRNTLTVRLRDVSKIGASIDEAIGAGANDLGGIRFGFQDQAELMETARRRAVSDAKAVASVLAEEAGVELGRVLTMSLRESYGAPQPVAMARMESDAATPIEAGESALSALVNVTFELE